MTGAADGAYLGLWFDAALAVLLIATIVYAAILNRKLTELRSAKGDMERLLAGFAQSTDRADAALKVLREAAGEAGERLQGGITKGNAVADDLMFLIERAGSLADRLETTGKSAPRPDGGKRGADSIGGGCQPDPVEAPTFAKPAGFDGPESAVIKALRGVR